MEINLVRRWGVHQPGETVEVDDAQGRWLIDNSFGETAGNPGTASANAKAPGEEGSDLRAGGDHSRRRMTAAPKGPRDGERAGRVQGAPKRAGDVSHVAPENLDHASYAKAERERAAQEAEHAEQLDAAKSSGDENSEAAQDSPGASGEATQDEPEGRRLTQRTRKSD